MKIFSATVLTLGLLTAASPASFANVNQVPLAPGKPAGVHAAQFWEGDRGIFIVAGAAAIGIGVALATANNNAASPNNTGSSSVSSTSTTAP